LERFSSIPTPSPTPQYLPLGEQVLIVQFDKEMSIEVNQRVHYLASKVRALGIKGVKQLFPTFCSLSISYDPVMILYDELVAELQKMNVSDIDLLNDKGKVFHVPVVYGGSYGPDLDDVAAQTGLSPDEVVKIHQDTPYLIYMLGFNASMPYCGDVDSRLSLPRRTTPRLNIEQGSIAIANRQTIIYPVSSPGGWHVIGRTPMRTFNPYLDPPTIFKAGDYMKFEPIAAAAAEAWNEHKQREWNDQWNL
jgi:inhibitor of KinA